MEGHRLTVVPTRGYSATAAAVTLRPRARLGEILCTRQIITSAQLSAVLSRQTTMEARIGDLLRVEANVQDEDLLSALEDQWASRRINLEHAPPDPSLVRRVGFDTCLALRLLPWRRIGAATVIVSVYPDRFQQQREALEELYGPVMLALCSEADFRACLTRCFPAEIRRRNEMRLSDVESCRSWKPRPFQLASLGVITGVASALAFFPGAAFLALTVFALLGLAALSTLKAAAAIAAWKRQPVGGGANIVPMHPSAKMRRPVVSLLVPLYHEDRIAEHLVKRLARLKYPEALLDICLIVESDDKITHDCLTRTKLGPSFRVLTVPEGAVKTKPRALNYALDQCRGSIVGVYDAEDAPDPDQIARVVTRFAQAPPDVACLQGRLGFYNARRNWLSRCFAIDYAQWFSIVLPGFERLGLPIPLGGTTLFFRREILEHIGAWDAFNVTEDADLGIRLTRYGYRTELIDTTTLEEANCRVWPWIRQRSRWLKGYAMTYATHMRHPARLWRELGPRGFLGLQVILLGALVQALLAPVLWSWWLIAFGLPHPLAPILSPAAIFAVTLLLIASEALNMTLSILALRRTGQTRLSLWILLMNPYFMLQTFAALKALAEMAYRPFFWDKTAHGDEQGGEFAEEALAAESAQATPIPA